jgi:gliding motility-associated-like protein
VDLIVSSDKGCVDSTNKTIEVKPISTLWIPSAFSPNADGKNELFLIRGINLRNAEWSVYNRFGQTVFSGVGLENGWDGYFNDAPAPEGVYIYKLKVLDVFNKEQEYTGRVSLIR